MVACCDDARVSRTCSCCLPLTKLIFFISRVGSFGLPKSQFRIISAHSEVAWRSITIKMSSRSQLKYCSVEYISPPLRHDHEFAMIHFFSLTPSISFDFLYRPLHAQWLTTLISFSQELMFICLCSACSVSLTRPCGRRSFGFRSVVLCKCVLYGRDS